MIAPFTLIIFHCNEIELVERGMKDDPTPLAQILESTKEHRVKIYLGAYVFDTKKGWQDMHRLCEFLRSRRRNFLRLPFEGELFGYTDDEVAKSLEKLGVILYKYPEVER